MEEHLDVKVRGLWGEQHVKAYPWDFLGTQGAASMKPHGTLLETLALQQLKDIRKVVRPEVDRGRPRRREVGKRGLRQVNMRCDPGPIQTQGKDH